MATELSVFVLVRMTANAALERAAVLRITRTGTRTDTPINVNAAFSVGVHCELTRP